MFESGKAGFIQVVKSPTNNLKISSHLFVKKSNWVEEFVRHLKMFEMRTDPTFNYLVYQWYAVDLLNCVWMVESYRGWHNEGFRISLRRAPWWRGWQFPVEGYRRRQEMARHVERSSERSRAKLRRPVLTILPGFEVMWMGQTKMWLRCRNLLNSLKFSISILATVQQSFHSLLSHSVLIHKNPLTIPSL